MALLPRLPKLVVLHDVETSHTVNTSLDTTEARLDGAVEETWGLGFSSGPAALGMGLWPFASLDHNLGGLSGFGEHVLESSSLLGGLVDDAGASAFRSLNTLQRVSPWPFGSVEYNLSQLNLLTGHVFPTLPVLEDDVYEVPETDSGNTLILDVLANDRDDNVLNNAAPLLGPEMIIREIDLTGFTLGDVTIAEDGQSLIYTALSGVVLGPGQSLEETFTYSVTNLTGRTSTAEVTITIFNVNEAPIAEDIVQIITENIPAIVVEAVFSDGDPGDQHVISLNPAGTDTTEGNVSQNADGSFTYDPGTAFDYLAVGEEATDSFTYQVEDLEGATDTATVTLTITGENDGVELTPGEGTRTSTGVQELADGHVLENVHTHSRSGGIEFADADVSDTHSATAVPVASGYLGVFSVDTPTTTNTTTDGTVTWTFDLPDTDLDFLAQGEQRFQYYDVTIFDGEGGDVTQRVTVVISGTNDAVGILGGHVSDLTGSATEVADEAPGENVTTHNITGTVLFSDVDLADGHTATLTPLDSTAGNFVGTMGAPTLTRTAGDIQGKVDWSYNVNDALLDSLGVNDTIVERFTLTVSDDATTQAIATEIIELTLQGVNDTPTLVNGAAAAAEDGGTIQIDLAALGDDADAEDDGSTLVYAISQGPSEGQGSITGTTLTFDPGADFQDLALGEIRDVIIGLTATDAQGAVSDVNTVTVTVVGVNDAPTLIDGAASGLENEGLNLDLAALGDDVDSDNDGGDLTYEIVGAPEYGSASITGTSLSLDQGTDFDDLATGETRQVTVQVQATDRHEAVSTTQSVIVTVTGVNDAPIIVEADQADTITETASGGGVADGPDEPDDSTANADNTGDNFPPDGGVGGGLDGGLPTGGGQTGVHTAMGVFTFTDVDASDDHTIEVTALGDDAANNVGALVVSPAAIASGEAKAFEWTFEVAETAINAMAAGDQRVQTYEMKVTDSANPGLSDTRIVTITIDGRNDAPVVAGALSAAATENGAPVSINLFEGATDPDNGAVLSIADLQVEGSDDFGQTPGISYDAASGVLSLNPNQTAYESLNAGEVRDITATYSVADEHGAKRAQTATFVLTGVNDAPGAMDALFATDEASAVRSSASSLGFDVDAQNSGNNLDYEILQGPAKGLASFPADPANGDRDFLFDPNGQFEYLGVNQFEDVTVTYRAIDDHNASSPTAAITIRVHGVNDEATITGDNAGTVTEDGDADADNTTAETTNGALAITDVDTGQAGFAAPASLAGAYGTFTFLHEGEDDGSGNIVNVGGWTYALDNAHGDVQALNDGDTLTDSLTVTSLDGTASETINVTVHGVDDNQAPVANDDAAQEAPIEVLIVSGGRADIAGLTAQLEDDTYFDFNTGVFGFDEFGSQTEWLSALSAYDVVIFGESGYGDAQPNQPFFWTALQEFNNNGGGVIAAGFGQLPLHQLNSHLRGVANEILPFELKSNNFFSNATTTIYDSDAPITAGLPGILDDGASHIETLYIVDSDADVLGSYGRYPTIVGRDASEQKGATAFLGYLYLGDAGSFRNGDLRSGAHDQLLEQTVAWAAGDMRFRIAEDGASRFIAARLLANDTDADGDTLSITQVDSSSAEGGTLTFDPVTGDITYTPLANFNGEDSFTYTVSDGNGGTDTATVTLNVAPVNDAPTMEGFSFTAARDTTTRINLTSLAADADHDVESLTYVLDFVSGNGAASIDGNELTISVTGSTTVTAVVRAIDPDGASSGPVNISAELNDTIGNAENGNNGRDYIQYEGQQGPVSKTLTNPYSGQTVIIDDTYNVNAATYDGLAGFDTLLMTNTGDYFEFVNEANQVHLWNLERILSGSGPDVINLAHETILYGNTYGNVVMNGGSGNDIVWANAGDDQLDGLGGDDNLDGGPGNDRLNGGDGDDTLFGGDGDDRLHGNNGDDKLFGGDGNDELYGNDGNDVMTGGAGSDLFLFHANLADDAVFNDTITDFSQAEGDILDFTNMGVRDVREVSANGGTSTLLELLDSEDAILGTILLGKVAFGDFDVYQSTDNVHNAVIGGQDTGVVTEDSALTTGGTLTISDPDPNEDFFSSFSSGVNSHGTFSITADGVWSYVLDNTHAEVQALNSGESLTDSFTVKSADGTEHLVEIEIHGATDFVFDFDGINQSTTFSQNGFTISQVQSEAGHTDANDSLRWHDNSGNPADQDFVLTRDDGGSFNLIALDHLFGDFIITSASGNVLFDSAATGSDVPINLFGLTSATFEVGSEAPGASPAHIDNLDISFMA